MSTDDMPPRKAIGLPTLGLDIDPDSPVGMRTSAHGQTDTIVMNFARFSHSDRAEFTHRRGTFARDINGRFPDVYVADDGSVEIDEARMTSGEAVTWLRAIADHIERRTPDRKDPCGFDMGEGDTCLLDAGHDGPCS